MARACLLRRGRQRRGRLSGICRSGWQTAQHGRSAGIVADLTCDHEGGDRATGGLQCPAVVCMQTARGGDGMQFGGHPPIWVDRSGGRAGRQAPLFRPQDGGRAMGFQIGSVRCPAVDCKAINKRGSSPSSEPPPRTPAVPSTGRKRPVRGFQRLQRVFGGPCSFKASRHCKPLRLMKIIPFNRRRPRTLGLPWLWGKNG